MNGKIKSLSKKRGFGFIRNDNDEDIFFHVTNLNNSKQFGTIQEGDTVEFNLKKGKKGLRADDIRLVKPEENTEQLMVSALTKLKNFFNS